MKTTIANFLSFAALILSDDEAEAYRVCGADCGCPRCSPRERERLTLEVQCVANLMANRAEDERAERQERREKQSR